MFISLRLRLLASYLLVIGLTLGLAGFVLLSSLERYLVQSVEDGLVMQGRLISQVMFPGGDVVGPAVDPQAAMSNFQQNNRLYVENSRVSPGELVDPAQNALVVNSELDTRIRVVDAQGLVLMDNRGNPGESLSADTLVSQGLQGQYVRRLAKATGATGATGTVMLVVLPVRAAGQVTGVVYLSQSLRDATAVLADLRSRLLFAAAAAVLFSAIVGLWLAQAMTRPIRQLTQATATIAQNASLADLALQPSVRVRSRDELGRLGQAFNAMLTRLQQAQQMQTDFVANVSHELRTPLTAVKGMVETLRDGAVDDLAVRDNFLQTIEQETDRLIRLVNDLMILSRVDSQALPLRLQTVALGPALQEVITRLEPQAAARQVTVTQTVAAAVQVRADPDRLKQVLLNLLVNAIQYSHPGGGVTIQATAQAGQARLVLQDQGIGIAAADLAHIGERFYRADKARSRAQGGSGLGVAIARALIEAHGGQLTLASQADQGTTVTVTWPCA